MKKVELVHLLYDALALTRNDAERDGFKYGSQSNCAVAMRKAQKFLAEGRDCKTAAVMRKRQQKEKAGMSEMVEKVARAIWPDAFDGDGAGWHQRRDVALQQARAAIEAMRVPTEAMEEAGGNLDDWGVPSDPGSGNATALAHWTAMIDEALK